MLSLFKSKPVDLLQRRLYSTGLSLSFDKYSFSTIQRHPPILICHGLFGSKQNWTSLSKSIGRTLGCDVYSIDLRNHGDSPHSAIHTYEAMSTDLARFMEEHQLSDPMLVGHSMGGKAVMTTALRHPDLISKMVVVDMPPVAMTLSHGFKDYIKAMKQIEDTQPQSQTEANQILAAYEANDGIRKFLLTNLKRQPDGSLRFRIPYDILGRALTEIAGFTASEGAVYDKPTLFIAGGISPYLKPFENQENKIKELFPNMELAIVEGAGHWVHAEKPKEVMKMICSFYTDK